MRVFRVFLSSTFNDLEPEREAFRQRVVPELQRLCRSEGADFQAVDLRWGISEEAGFDQRTVQICLSEIRRCLAVTPRPNFVILLGDRYGWRPVPAQIPAALFERITKTAGTGISLLQKWYGRDDNAVPPVYRLKPRAAEFQDTCRWGTEEATLLRVLEEAALHLHLSDAERVLFGASATEQEIQFGALSSNATDRVFCYFRNIGGDIPESAAGRYFDSAACNEGLPPRTRVQRLKARLRSALPGAVREYETAWGADELSSNHIDLFCRDVQASLEEVIKRELSDPVYQDALQRERSQHTSFACERTRIFVGRRDLLELMQSHTMSSSRASFALIGASGTGKSAVMAKAALEFLSGNPDTVVIYRFAGVTPQSSDIASLLRSLCKELARAYSRDESTVPHNYEDLVLDFRNRLAYAHVDHPLIVMIDALDQLSDIGVRSSLPWIPVELRPYTRLFVSALPELRESVSRVIPEAKIALLRPLHASECREIVDELLQDGGRVLHGAQRSAVEEHCIASPFPLYIRLLLQQVLQWQSGTPVPALGQDVPSLLDALFEDLSRPANHGPLLVSRTLGLIAATRQGLSEDELMENLSADPEVMEEFHKRSVHYLSSKALPPIVWSRLHDDLEPYLTTRGADGVSLLAFFHRQFQEKVQQLYLEPERLRLHRQLAGYFSSQPLYLDAERQAPNLRKLSELSFQQVRGSLPMEAQKVLLTPGFLEAKLRALGPQPLADDFDAALAAGCCTNPAALQPVRDAILSRAHVLRGDPGQFHSQLTGRLCGVDEPEIERLLDEIRQQAPGVWLRPITRSLGSAGEAMIRILGGHEAVIWQISVSRSGRFAASAGNDNRCIVWDLEACVELHRLPHDEPVLAVAITDDERGVICAAGATLTFWDLTRGVKLRSEQTETGSIRALAVAPGDLAFFGSDEGVIGAWDLATGTVNTVVPQTFPIHRLAVLPDQLTIVAGRSQTFAGEEGPVLAAWNLRTAQLIGSFGAGRRVNSMILAGANSVLVALDDGLVQLWNVGEGTLEKEFRYSDRWADGAAIAPDGGRVVAGGVEHSVKVWDTASQELVATLKGHHNIVRTTAFLPDGHRLLSGSDDQTIRLWDLRRTRTSSPEPAHGGKVHTLCQSPDGTLVVSGSADCSVKFWDPHTGRCTDSLAGHTAEVWSAAFTPDGATLITLQNGWRAIVWDVASRSQRQVLQLVPRAIAYADRVVPCADNRHFFCGGEMFEIDTGKVACQLPEYETGVVAALPDGDRILFHINRTPLRVWSLKENRELATLPGSGYPAALLDETRLVTSGYEFTLWDIATWTRIRTCSTGHRGSVNAIAAIGGERGLVATFSGDHDAKLWDLESGEHLATFTAESPLVSSVICNSVPVVIAGDELGNLHFLRIEGARRGDDGERR